MAARRPHQIARLALTLVLAAAGSKSRVSAQSGVQETRLEHVVAFDIPQEPLDRALITFGQTANISVLYDSALLTGQNSTAVKGVLRSREALELLLQGTGLCIRFTTPAAVTLVRIGQGGHAILALEPLRVEGSPVLRDRRALTLYAERLRDRILLALKNSSVTNRNAYDISVEIWLGSTGSISRVELVSSIATIRADAILTVIKTAGDDEPPPIDLPQPIPFRFRSTRIVLRQ